MSILLLDPVGEVDRGQHKREHTLGSLTGKNVGYIFNQHISALAFWKTLEREVEATLKPSRVHRIYKTNTWAAAPQAEVERLVRETDYALVGVGA